MIDNTKKTVIICGVLNKRGSTNIPQALSFIRFGFNVIPINYRTIISEYGMEYFGNLLIYIINKTNPVLVLFSKCNGVDPDIIKRCNKLTKTWLFNMDPISTIKRCPEVIEHARNAHFSSCTGGGVVEWFREQGVDNCVHIIEGLDYTIFKPVEPVDEFKAEISFIGTSTQERSRYKKLLEEAGIDVRFYGTGYSNKEMIEEDFAKICSSSKFMLSINTQNDIPMYFSDRVLRYLGCGSCVLHFDPIGTMDKFFKIGDEILTFKYDSELLEVINNTNIESAGKIALAGREKVLMNYTWDHSVATILNILGFVNGR
uniref:Putative glycosyltransferase n=1 Tax=viral metagenome TaxID=1070528 RepID=A0A6M3IXY4_9ZZZZ